MSRRDDRDRASRSQPQASYSSAGRTGQFVIDAEGIDREVITADICRYLGNDALVKPGDVEDPRTKQLKPVYVITAYRNLTNAMIHDLKQASADWRAERLARSSAQYPTNGISLRDSNEMVRKSNTPIVVDYRTSNALDQSIARMDATQQPRPAAQQGMYNSPSAAVPSSQSYQPSGQGYSAGYSQPTSYQNDGYTQPPSQQYAPSAQGYPTQDTRSYVHGSNYAVEPAGRGGSVPQSVPRTQAVPYPPTTSYQAPAPQYYSQSGPPASTSAYAAHAPTDPYYSRGNYETTPEIYDTRAYPETSDYQMQDAGYTEPGSYQETVSYSQPMPSGRSGTATSSSSQRTRDRDSRDDRDRHHQRRRN
ncbi:hypothetical protein MFRU_010g00440 [Monilinia fructicola]|nr:hypothetical protein MFRU_010g00440 [Monilinia fructicola]